jgi:hypothetical protein
MATPAQLKLREDKIAAATSGTPEELKLAKMSSGERRFSKRNEGKDKGGKRK